MQPVTRHIARGVISIGLRRRARGAQQAVAVDEVRVPVGRAVLGQRATVAVGIVGKQLRGR